MPAKSDFGKQVADAWRGIKKDFQEKPVPPDGQKTSADDPSVREQIFSDIDHLIEKHEERKPFPGEASRGPLDIGSSLIR